MSARKHVNPCLKELQSDKSEAMSFDGTGITEGRYYGGGLWSVYEEKRRGLAQKLRLNV